jgi:hypothetical protein
MVASEIRNSKPELYTKIVLDILKLKAEYTLICKFSLKNTIDGVINKQILIALG